MDADGIIQAASYMPLFPVIGAVIGLLVVLVVNVEFWWRYLRRSDNKRFWKPQTKKEMN
jgi:membrane protein implicated in regulation of membrane protease activity